MDVIAFLLTPESLLAVAVIVFAVIVARCVWDLLKTLFLFLATVLKFAVVIAIAGSIVWFVLGGEATASQEGKQKSFWEQKATDE